MGWLNPEKIMCFSLLVLTGCSSEKKSEYDPVELIEYEACLSQIVSDYQYNEIEKYLEWCQELRPSKG